MAVVVRRQVTENQTGLQLRGVFLGRLGLQEKKHLIWTGFRLCDVLGIQCQESDCRMHRDVFQCEVLACGMHWDFNKVDLVVTSTIFQNMKSLKTLKQ